MVNGKISSGLGEGFIEKVTFQLSFKGRLGIRTGRSGSSFFSLMILLVAVSGVGYSACVRLACRKQLLISSGNFWVLFVRVLKIMWYL